MTQRLVPKRIQDLLATNDLPPGHRFRLYLEGWGRQWEMEDQEKRKLDFAYGPAGDLLRALIQRQRELFPEGATVWKAERASLAPFVTGMGLPHPLENGFAFLDPYGIPYLPGSSVKGVLKRAAEELTLFEQDRKGWTVAALWWLLGFESTSAYLAQSEGRWQEAFAQRLQDSRENEEANAFLKAWDFTWKDLSDLPRRSKVHHRGALVFLDVFPDPPETPRGKMTRTDILNPHYAPYYQKQEAPADNANPIPNYFLTLPENTRFSFTILFRPAPSLPSDIASRWKNLVEEAFRFAALHLGFGGKTSQGYGRMDGERALPLRPQDSVQGHPGGHPPRRNEGSPAGPRSRNAARENFPGNTAQQRSEKVPGQASSAAQSSPTSLEKQVAAFQWNPANPQESQKEAERLLDRKDMKKHLAVRLLEKIQDKKIKKELRRGYPNLFG